MSSSQYDLMTAQDMGIAQKGQVNRGHEQANHTEIKDIGGLPVGLL